MAQREPLLDLPQPSCSTARRSLIAPAALLLLALLVACGPTGPTGAPTQPRDVAVTAIPGGVRVTWLDQSSDEDGFLVFRKDAGVQGEPTDEVGAAGAGEQVFDDFSTTQDGSYVYGVAAVNVIGPSETVLQDPQTPVSELPGVDVSVTFDGEGVVLVSGGSVNKVCVTDCSVAFAAGTDITLTAQSSDDAVFAGWAGDCGGAGTCGLEVDEPLEVEARFRRHVLQLELDGDSPVELTMFPADDFGNSKCTLDTGDSCALAYGFAGPLAVSINAVKLEPAGQFQGFEGPCSTEQGMYCLANVSGATPVAVRVVLPPVAQPDAYGLREDQDLEVAAGSGVLANDTDSASDTLSAVLLSGPANGGLDLDGDGSFNFAPNENFNGSDSFQYVARDSYGSESEAVTVTLSVQAANDPPVFSLGEDPPVATGDFGLRTVEDFATNMGPGGGPDEATQSLTAFTVEKVGGNIEGMNPQIDLNGTLTFRPPFGSSGSATYAVRLSDNGGTANGGEDTSAAQQFTITVQSFTLAVGLAGSGDVSASPAADDGEYGYGTVVNLDASAGRDHAFGVWQGDCQGSVASCELTMVGDRTVTARFDPFVRVRFADGTGLISVSSNPGGISGCLSLNVNINVCDAPFPDGSSVTLTASIGQYRFQGVVCSSGQPTRVCNFTVDGPVVVTLAPANTGTD